RPLNSDFTFKMSRAGDEYRVDVSRPGAKGGTARINFVYGSRGIGDEMYFTWDGDQMFEIPVAWLYPQQGWGNTTVNPHGSGHFGREPGPRSLECHTPWSPYVAGSHNQYRRGDHILGVTCERCHGPGREHVAYHKAKPGVTTPHAVVQPKSL